VFAAHAEAFLKPLAAGAPDDLDAAASRSMATVLAAGRRRYAGGAEPFDAVRYILEIAAAVENGLLSLKPSGRNRVQVYDAVMALPKEYKTVFVADLLEKSFPQAVTEDPLFKDEERRMMNGGDPVLDERAWRLSGERYFFYMAVTRAREKVYFTHSTHDEDGKPVLRSFFVDEALGCFAPGMCRLEEKGPAGFLPGPAEWETEADVVRGLAGFLREPEARRPAFFVPLAAHWRDSAAFIRASENRPVAGPARLYDPRAIEAMRTFAGPFSATGFDAFYKCAYRHFAESLLKLRRPPEEFQDAEIGVILHEVLHDYFSTMPAARLKSGSYWKEAGVMERELEALLDTRFAAAFGDQPLYRRAMFRASMGAMLRGYAKLERRAAVETGLVPVRFEYDFGKGGADYLRIPDESGEILLKGSIDRIDVDVSGKRAVVIDYKKSSRKLKDKLKKGEEIQLPLYSYAAKRLLGLDPLGIEHRILRTGKRENPEYSTEKLEALLVVTEARIREAVRRIRRGEIAVEPKECDFCSFDAVCRIDARKDRRAY
jgi:ATP-dependent helicase/nuclease subunit B